MPRCRQVWQCAPWASALCSVPCEQGVPAPAAVRRERCPGAIWCGYRRLVRTLSPELSPSGSWAVTPRSAMLWLVAPFLQSLLLGEAAHLPCTHSVHGCHPDAGPVAQKSSGSWGCSSDIFPVQVTPAGDAELLCQRALGQLLIFLHMPCPLPAAASCHVPLGSAPSSRVLWARGCRAPASGVRSTGVPRMSLPGARTGGTQPLPRSAQLGTQRVLPPWPWESCSAALDGGHCWCGGLLHTQRGSCPALGAPEPQSVALN